MGCRTAWTCWRTESINMTLINLFFVFFRIGLFAVGGAYSFLPLIEKEVVQRYGWLTKQEFLDVLGMTKILPGAISVKYATYTGYKTAGLGGAVMANLGNLLAPVLLVLSVSMLYAKYKNISAAKGAFNMIQLVMFAMIISVAFQLIAPGQLLQPRSLIVVAASILLFVFTRVHPGLIIILAGLIGAILK